MKTKIKHLGLVYLILCLSGCASSNPPQTSMTEAQIYHEAMQQSNVESLNQTRLKVQNQMAMKSVGKTNINSFSDTASKAQKRLQKQFPQFPDPETIVYVYPHLGPDGVPVPGYYTKFHLYQENYYALPGEGENN